MRLALLRLASLFFIFTCLATSASALTPLQSDKEPVYTVSHGECQSSHKEHSEPTNQSEENEEFDDEVFLSGLSHLLFELSQNVRNKDRSKEIKSLSRIERPPRDLQRA